ncbi:MFS transporter [Candidatus Woesearchaeota archaeon]|nr:MFS transporter [Candidatus Woesearchaeota archaeon]
MRPELKYLLWSKLLVGVLTGFLLIGLPLYLSDLGLELSEIGSVFGLAMLVYALISYYLGSYSESSGRLVVGVISIAGMALSSLFFGIMPLFSVSIALFVFVISKILFNLSDSILRNIVKIRVLDLTNSEQLGSNYGFLIFADSLGHGLGILLGGVLVSAITFQMVFFGLALLTVVSLFFYLKTGDLQEKSKPEKIFRISNLINTSWTFKIVLLVNTILLLGIYLVDYFGLPLFQKEVLQMSNEQIFLLLGTAWLLYALFSYLGGKLYDRYGLKLLLLSLLLIGITSILLAFTRNIVLFSSLVILDYIFFAFADPARFALAGLVSLKKKGMLMSFFEFFSLLAAALVLLFFGKLVAIFGFEFIFILRGIGQFMAIGLMLLIYTRSIKLSNR